MNIGDWLARREMLTPNKTALIDMNRGGLAISYRAWNRSVNRTAWLLHKHIGVRRGDRVAVLSMNCVEYLDIWFACGKLGAIMQTLNWRLTPNELRTLIADGAPVVLCYGPEAASQVRALRAEGTAELRYIACTADARIAPEDIVLDERECFPDSPLPYQDIGWDDPWVICYTGGTTGTPKGAILSYGNIFWNSVNTVMSWGLCADDVTILNAPLYHTGGLNVFTAPLVHIGGTSIVCRTFDVEQVFDVIRDGRVTLFFGVPTMFAALQQHPRWSAADFTRLRLVISGGAPCPHAIFEAFWSRGVAFKTGYGLTEAGPNTFWLPPEDVRRKPGSVGFPLFHIDVQIVDSKGQECRADQIGELWVRGPHVCRGYWNRPEETAQTIIDGWLHTGDLAYRDSEGYYTIVGRLKDVIISGGENIYPSEIESILADHPAVALATLIGIPDEHWGEVGRAVVVLHPEHTTTAETLIAFCREHLANYKVPKSIVFVDTLPYTGAGKIDKQRVRERYGQNS